MSRTHARFMAVRRIALAAVVLGGVLGDASPASAVQPCTNRSTTRAFARFGDDNDYFHVPNGNFESGLSSWSVNYGSPYVVGDNQNLVWITGGVRAIVMPPGSSITSIDFCTSVSEDAVRMFFKQLSWSASISVKVEVRTAHGVGGASSSRVTYSYGYWDAYPRVPVPDVRDQNGQQITRVTVTVNSGWVVLDDVMIDPLRLK